MEMSWIRFVVGGYHKQGVMEKVIRDIF